MMPNVVHGTHHTLSRLIQLEAARMSKRQLEALQSENQEQKQTIQSLQAENKDLRDKVEAVTRERDALKAKLEAYEATFAAAKVMFAGLPQEAQQLQ